jgi:hypothetical protein
MSDASQMADTWCVRLGSNRSLHVSGVLTKPESFDDLIRAIEALSPMLPWPRELAEVDGEWASERQTDR